ncbi:MAG: hypothetical protein AAF366_01435 [Pseudomonadota bacterium]
MPLIVTAQLYSGRANPTWVVSDDRFVDLSRQFPLDEGGPSVVSPRLGYRGLRIRHTDPDLNAAPMMTRNAMSNANAGALVAGEPDLESALIETHGDVLGEAALNHIRQRIQDGPERASSDGTVTCPTNHGKGAPSYDASIWNSNPDVQKNNNCYNYGNNQITNNFAQPGYATGKMWDAFTCSNVSAAATRDGLAAVGDVSADISGWYVALVIWPDEDYHWYRQDDIGCWSHKAGEDPATNLDDAKKQITDPQTCDRGPYTTWCTYMTTDKSVKIAGPR